MQQIVNGMVAHMSQYRATKTQWYCGVTADPNERLVNGHNAGDNSRYWDCGTDTAARAIEQHFLGLGCQGGPGGGDHTAKYVYIYIVTASTRE